MTRRKEYTRAMERTVSIRVPLTMLREARTYHVEISRTCRSALFQEIQRRKAYIARRGDKP